MMIEEMGAYDAIAPGFINIRSRALIRFFEVAAELMHSGDQFMECLFSCKTGKRLRLNQSLL